MTSSFCAFSPVPISISAITIPGGCFPKGLKITTVSVLPPGNIRHNCRIVQIVFDSYVTNLSLFLYPTYFIVHDEYTCTRPSVYRILSNTFIKQLIIIVMIVSVISASKSVFFKCQWQPLLSFSFREQAQDRRCSNNSLYHVRMEKQKKTVFG